MGQVMFILTLLKWFEHILVLALAYATWCNTVGARIPNAFGIRMVYGVRFSNGIRFSNGKTRWPPFCSVFKWSGPFEIRTMVSLGRFKYKEKNILCKNELD